MRLQITPPAVVCPHQVMAPIAKSLSAAYSSIKEKKRDQFLVRQFVLSSPFKLKKFFKSPTLDKGDSGIHRITRSCSASLDEEFAEYHVEDLAQSWGGLSDDEESRDYLINKGCCGTSETESSPSKDKDPMFSKNFFWQSQVDLLEPKMLGIRPEPPDWPESESVIWADIEQKAKSFDLPLSLKMIQKKHQREGSFKEMGELAYSSMKKAFSSMLFIIVELQSYGLQMREALCDENLELIISKVQRDMQSSFVWLFQHVFSRTPALMIHIMILLANFSVHSTSHNFAAAQASLLVSLCETAEEITSLQHSQIDNLSMASLTSSDNNRSGREVDLEASRADIGNGDSNYLAMSSKHLNAHPEEFLQVGNQEFRSVTEVSLWNSFLDEATKMRAGPNEPILDHTVLQKFVSPISVDLEPDDYIEYLRTDLMYQMGLSQEPNNPLLLSNYAQYLHLVARDYDRAEECFKQAIQVEIPDAESLSLYADFLWTVRKDLWRAEDAYLQALSIEPENPYYASKYASFLWNTGGEETCFPLDASNIDSNS